MTAAKLVARAEHALKTNQPNLAALYMRRATEYLDAERATIKQDYRKACKKISPWAPIRFMFQDITEAVRWIAKSDLTLHQADFALAGPSKGGTT